MPGISSTQPAELNVVMLVAPRVIVAYQRPILFLMDVPPIVASMVESEPCRNDMGMGRVPCCRGKRPGVLPDGGGAGGNGEAALQAVGEARPPFRGHGLEDGAVQLL